MTKKILILLFFCVGLYFLSGFSFFSPIRLFLERFFVLPFRKNIACAPCAREMKLVNAEAKIKNLEEQNKVLKKQLGFIPEKKDLLLLEIIWSTEREYYLSFPYTAKQDLVGKDVIYENQYLGKIIRQGASVLVAEKPVVSEFVERAKTDEGVVGFVKGQYNDALYFEVPLDSKIQQNDLVYLISSKNSFLYLLGKINRIEKKVQQSLQRGYIDYLPQRLKLKFAFVVL